MIYKKIIFREKCKTANEQATRKIMKCGRKQKQKKKFNVFAVLTKLFFNLLGFPRQFTHLSFIKRKLMQKKELTHTRVICVEYFGTY